MATSGVNVLRFSALFAGVSYGFYRQSTLSAQQKSHEIKQKYRQEENLITQAKAAYVKKTTPNDLMTPGGGVISDPDDPQFDLEAYITMKTADEAK